MRLSPLPLPNLPAVTDAPYLYRGRVLNNESVRRRRRRAAILPPPSYCCRLFPSPPLISSSALCLSVLCFLACLSPSWLCLDTACHYHPSHLSRILLSAKLRTGRYYSLTLQYLWRARIHGRGVGERQAGSAYAGRACLSNGRRQTLYEQRPQR